MKKNFGYFKVISSYWFLLPLLFTIGLAIAKICNLSYSSQLSQIIIKASVSRGSFFEIFLNDNYTTPIRAKITPGEVKEYIFDINNTPYNNIKKVRLDPSDEIDADIVISRVALVKDSKVIKTFRPDRINKWSKSGVKIESISKGEIKFSSTTSDPVLEGSPNFPTDNSFLSYSIPFVLLNEETGFFIYLFCSFILLILLTRTGKEALLISIASVVIVFTAYCFNSLAIHAQEIFPPSAKYAVGNAILSGYAPSKSVLELFASFIIVIIGGAWAAKLFDRSIPKSMAEISSANQIQGNSDPNQAKFWFCIGLIVLAAVWFFPPFSALAQALEQRIHAIDFDSQNLLSWQYAAWKGWLPFKDFWYPYGIQLNTSLPWPPDIINFFIHRTLLFAVLIWGLYQALDRNLFYLVTLVVLVFIGGDLNVFNEGAIPRYLLSASLVIIFPLVLNSSTIIISLFYGLWLTYVAVFDITQVYYAFPGCTCLFLYKVIQEAIAGRSVLPLLRKATSFGVVATISFCIISYTMHSNGQLKGVLSFLTLLNEQANYGALPVNLPEWFILKAEPISVIFLASLFTAFFSAYSAFTCKRGINSIYSFVPLALCLTDAFIFQKQVIRPHMILQFSFFPILSLSICLQQLAYSKFSTQRRYLLLAASMLVGFGVQNYAYNNKLGETALLQLVAKLAHFPKDLKSSLLPPIYWENLAHKYFAPGAFSFGDQSGVALKGELSKILGEEDFYVFGDDALLYVLFDKKIPPYITFYNASILYSQREMVSWLEKETPSYVIWKTKNKVFDSVQNYVRVPLIFNHVLRNYIPSAEYGDFNILKKRSSTDRVAFDYWVEVLGNSIDLGLIPAFSGAEESEASSSKTSIDTTNYAVIDTSNDKYEHSDFLSVNINNKAFDVSFKVHPKITKYYIRLDRIWFYQLATEDKLPISIAETTKGGNKVEIELTKLKEDILY